MPVVNLKEFARTRIRFDSSGQGLVEYALLLVLITVVIIAIVAVLGQQLGNTYELINATVPNVGK
ncbi:Flp family type IVb pilin [Geomonas edaphica]|uniref:Flp family type IVb pilin n=1 Tax=Geomonas edaphica TaxID=2570226 RepID=UPI0010A8848B|nr:Flp family type IVb pilin [Geomonas edaphica]